MFIIFSFLFYIFDGAIEGMVMPAEHGNMPTRHTW
jgi:hypothetical protein